MIKQLTDQDIAAMIGEKEFSPDDKTTKQQIISHLHLSTRIPQEKSISKQPTIDFHNHTEEEAWQMLLYIINSGTREATIITGASGILKPKFQDWVANSIIAPYIISVLPINNGSFHIKIRKNIVQKLTI